MQLKLRKLGGSLAVVVPREIIEKMNLADGDRLVLTKAPNGGYHLDAVNPEFDIQMKIARTVMRKYRNTLRELSK